MKLKDKYPTIRVYSLLISVNRSEYFDHKIIHHMCSMCGLNKTSCAHMMHEAEHSFVELHKGKNGDCGELITISGSSHGLDRRVIDISQMQNDEKHKLIEKLKKEICAGHAR